jgi:hypothetical protein
MKLLSRKYQIKADIDHVIRCFTDFETIAKAITDIEPDGRVKPAVKSDGFYLAAEKPMIKISQFATDSNGIYSARITLLPEQLKRLGDAVVSCSFLSNQDGTSVVTTIESEKTPNPLWRLFIKIIALILALQSRSEEKQYIKWIEQNA